MMKKNTKQLITMASFAALISLSGISTSYAAVQEPSQQPLFTAQPAPPGVVLVLDDSGSMDVEILAAKKKYADNGFGSLRFRYWEPVDAEGQGNSSMRRYLYTFTGSDGYIYDTNNAAYDVPITAALRSSEYNAQYYDPNLARSGKYKAWPIPKGATSISFPGYNKNTGKVNLNSVPLDPFNNPGRSSVISLKSHSYTANVPIRTFDFDGNTVSSGTRMRNNQYLPVYYSVVDSSSSLPKSNTVIVVDRYGYGDPDDYEYLSFSSCELASSTVNQNFQNFSQYALFSVVGVNNNRIYSNQTLQSYLKTRGVDSFGPDGQCLKRNVITDSNELQEYAKWFMFYRKRVHAARAAYGLALIDQTNLRLGSTTINYAKRYYNNDGGNIFSKPIHQTMPLHVLKDATHGSYNGQMDDMLDRIYKLNANGSTYNKHGLYYAMQQFQRTDANAPVELACQKNYAMLFTDGYNNRHPQTVGDADAGSLPPFTDGGNSNDGVNKSDTLADIAYYFNQDGKEVNVGGQTKVHNVLGLNNLPSLGSVPVVQDCDNPVGSRNPQSDCATHPHVNTIAVSLGVKGRYFGREYTYEEPNDSGVLEVKKGYYRTIADAHRVPPSPWGGDQVDDLYHAAVNGKGKAVNSADPAQLVDGIQESFDFINAGKNLNVNSVTADSGSLVNGSFMYKASYKTRNWYGELQKLAVKIVGTTVQVESGTPNWSAGALLSNRAWDQRKIYTSKDTTVASNASSVNGLVDLTWSNLSQDEQKGLSLTYDTGSEEAAAKKRLNYIKGDPGYDGQNNFYRNRKPDDNSKPLILGDIVNSVPSFIGANLDFSYQLIPDFPGANKYADFVKKRAAEKREIIVVGANDGMLHGFNPDNGEELWAWMPRMFLQPVNSGPSAITELTRFNYKHRYYVDGTAKPHDIWDGSKWRTVVVGSMGAGGRGIFAMDVTVPTAPKLLWEIDNKTSGFSGLGYHIGSINVGLSKVGASTERFQAFVSSGFGISGEPGTLYIIDVLTGNLTKKLKTHNITDTSLPGSDNGLAPSYPTDYDGDFRVDSVYAGDLYGNLWKFDLSGNNKSSWALDYNGKPLFNTCNSSSGTYGVFECPQQFKRPITSQPIVARSVFKTPAIYFGTGKLYDNDDLTSNFTAQGFYGIFEKDGLTASGNGAVLKNSDLLQQSIVASDVVKTGNTNEVFRAVSNNMMTADKKGWVLNFNIDGDKAERIIYEPNYSNGKVVFNTLIPDGAVCTGGGSSWTMVLNGNNGGRFKAPVIDANGDGLVTGGEENSNGSNSSDDNIGIGGNVNAAASGYKSNGRGVVGTAGINQTSVLGRDCISTIGSANSSKVDCKPLTGPGDFGRSSWYQSFPAQ